MKKLIHFIVLLLIPFSLYSQYKIGDKVSDFELQGTDGKKHNLFSMKENKGIILVFTCNTCPVAQKYEQRIISLHKQYASKGFPVVAVNSNDVVQKPGDSMEEMKKRSREKAYDFLYLRDDGQQVAKTFGAERTPEVFLLAVKGVDLVLVYTGAIDNNMDSEQDADKKYLAEALDQYISGEKIILAETRAVGCSIKWTE